MGMLFLFHGRATKDTMKGNPDNDQSPGRFNCFCSQGRLSLKYEPNSQCEVMHSKMPNDFRLSRRCPKIVLACTGQNAKQMFGLN